MPEALFHLTDAEALHLSVWVAKSATGRDLDLILDYLTSLDGGQGRQVVETRSWPEILRLAERHAGA